MLSVSLEILAVYLLLGFLASYLLRKGRPEDWDESLLASLLALPMFLLILLAVAAQGARKVLLPGDSGPTAHA